MTQSNSRVQSILDRESPLALPGVYDCLSALLAEQAGFPLGFVSGYSVAATALGEPDMGLLTQTEIVDRARAICRSVSIPILVDADTGYGNSLNVQRTVRDLIDAGAAGCFLEDQVWPKRCGHMKGKDVVSREEYLERIRAAVDARGDRDFFIVARSDALAIHGIDEAIERVAAARQAGANASFVEAPTSLQELEKIGSSCPQPNVANMIHGGRTPVLPRQELGRLGFDLILHPLAGLYSATATLRSVFSQLQSDGDLNQQNTPQMDFDDFDEIVRATEKQHRVDQLANE